MNDLIRLIKETWLIPIVGIIAGVMMAQATGGVTLVSVGAALLGASTYWALHIAAVYYIERRP
jgi:ABC-type amino acid transport system permease subunit